jgi:uncharacterized protein (TIGR02300 family)
VTGRFSHLDQRVANLANPELGAKQICPNCQSKFYDLGRRPARCPKCGESFDPEEALKSRRVRARSITPDYDAEDEKPAPAPKEEDGYEDEVDETPEIDEAAEEVVEPTTTTPTRPSPRLRPPTTWASTSRRTRISPRTKPTTFRSSRTKTTRTSWKTKSKACRARTTTTDVIRTARKIDRTTVRKIFRKKYAGRVDPKILPA